MPKQPTETTVIKFYEYTPKEIALELGLLEDCSDDSDIDISWEGNKITIRVEDSGP